MYYYRCNIKADGSFGSFILNDILGFKTIKSFNDWCKYNDEEKMYALVEKEYIKQNFEKLQQLIEKKDNNKSKIIFKNSSLTINILLYCLIRLMLNLSSGSNSVTKIA